MRYFITVVLVVVCAANIQVGFAKPSKDLRCVLVPAEQALMAVGSQPDSPLIFENVKAFSCIGRPGIYSY